MMHLVGLIPIPLPVTNFTALAAAYDAAFPGCTVGGGAHVVVRADGLEWTVNAVPVFVEVPA